MLDVACGTGLSLALLRERGRRARPRVRLRPQRRDARAGARARRRAGWRNVTLIRGSRAGSRRCRSRSMRCCSTTRTTSCARRPRSSACSPAPGPERSVAIAGVKYFPRWLAPLNVWVYFKNYRLQRRARRAALAVGPHRAAPGRLAVGTPTQFGMGYIASGRLIAGRTRRCDAAGGAALPRSRVAVPERWHCRAPAVPTPSRAGTSRAAPGVPAHDARAAGAGRARAAHAQLSMRNWWPTPGDPAGSRGWRRSSSRCGWLLLAAGGVARRVVAAGCWRGSAPATCCWCSAAMSTSPCRRCSAARSTCTGTASRFRRFLWVSARDYPWWVSAGASSPRWSLLLRGAVPRDPLGARQCSRARPRPTRCARAGPGRVTALAVAAVVAASGRRRAEPHLASGHAAGDADLRAPGRAAGHRLRCRAAWRAVLPPSTALDSGDRRHRRRQRSARLRGRDFKLIFLGILRRDGLRPSARRAAAGRGARALWPPTSPPAAAASPRPSCARRPSPAPRSCRT
ncbi:MAG: hypothetical protein MZW92_81315 [Comamonadaceae bacterium]|nr:hypothetical protein [Comamonadaceae bacterium]